MSLQEKVEFLNKKTGSSFTESEGEKCINFYYSLISDGWDLIDVDEYAMLNTLLGYDIGKENAAKINRDLWEHNIETLELDTTEEVKDIIRESAVRCEIQLDFTRWRQEPIECYEYYQEDEEL